MGFTFQQKNVFLLKLLSLITILSYTPLVKFNMTPFLYGVFAVIILLNFKTLIAVFFRFKWVTISLWMISNYYLIMLIVYDDVYIGDLKAFLVAAMMFYVFGCLRLTPNNVKSIFNFLAYGVIFSSIIAVILYKEELGSEILSSGMYFFRSKNGLAPLLSIAGGYFFIEFFESKKISILYYILSVTLLMIIKARTGLMALLIVSIIFVIKKNKLNKHKNIIIFILIIGIITGLTPILVPIIEKFIYNALNIEHVLKWGNSSNTFKLWDNILSGRLTHYVDSIEYLKSNLFLGIHFNTNIVIDKRHALVGVHSTVFRSIGYGGIIYFILFLNMCGSYLYYLKNKIKNNALLFFTLLIGLIMMFFEPTPPFGPGSSYMFFWMIVGFSVQSITKKRRC